VPAVDEVLTDSRGSISVLYPIKRGRTLVEADIFRNAAPKVSEFGIELLDLRFKRINYSPSVRQRIYERMISERQQIAERFRSEGAGEAAKILGQRQKDLQEIDSTAYRHIQKVTGEADAKATEIYANAYNQSPAAIEYYELIKTLETYGTILTNDTTVIMTTDSDLFKLLKRQKPN